MTPDASVRQSELLAATGADQIWEASPDAMLLVDHEGIIQAASQEAHRMFGYRMGDLVGTSVDKLVPSEMEATHREQREEFAAMPSRRFINARGTLGARRADGTTLDVNVALAPLDDDYVITAVRDVSGQVAIENQLIESTRRRMLAEDRERIARDLHDTVIQELFAMGMTLQATMANVTEPEIAARIDSTVNALDNVIGSIRGLIFDIGRPEPAGPSNIRAEIVDIAAGYTPSLGFEPAVSFRGPIDTAIGPECREHVMAVIREGMANVARHANASSASIELAIADAELTVQVTDDGHGIPSNNVRHSGLGNLVARAIELGGRCEAAAHPDGGTILSWVVPLTPNVEDLI